MEVTEPTFPRLAAPSQHWLQHIPMLPPVPQDLPCALQYAQGTRSCLHKMQSFPYTAQRQGRKASTQHLWL